LTAERVADVCWSCGQTVNDLFCPRCGKLQLLHENYFRCLDWGPQLHIDAADLELRFHDCSRKLHPDLYRRHTEAEQEISLQNTATLNAAYRTLKDPIQRLKYFISLIEGPSATPFSETYGLFDEILEVEGELDRLRVSTDRQKARETLSLLQAKYVQCYSKTERALLERFPLWDAQLQNDMPAGQRTQRCLSEMKQALSHQTYLRRIVEHIGTELEVALRESVR